MSGTCLVARWAEAEEEPVGHVRGPDLVLAPALVPHRDPAAPGPPRQARGHPVLARHHCRCDHCVQGIYTRYLPRYLHQLSTSDIYTSYLQSIYTYCGGPPLPLLTVTSYLHVQCPLYLCSVSPPGPRTINNTWPRASAICL